MRGGAKRAARKLIVGVISAESGNVRPARMIENDRTNINDAYGECGMSGYVLMRFYNVNGFLRVRVTSCPDKGNRYCFRFFSYKAKSLSH